MADSEQGADARIGLVTDPVFEEHDTGPAHPERPERLAAIRRALADSGLLARCRRLPLESASDELLLYVHEAGHLERVARACRSGARLIDSMDTTIGAASANVARLAAGSSVALARAVAGGALVRGFVAARPPGHHAERDLAMGFCLFNNVAIVAEDLRRNAGVGRVMIVDWDVHHGNGTQHIFEEDPDVFYFSLHQWPLYPGTGARDERGRGPGLGTTLNCPLPPGSGDDAFLGALRDELGPAAASFRPEFLLVSSGFDAHRRDPLADLEVTSGAYREATHIVRDIAERFAGGRLVSLLEGGYDLEALAESVTLHVEALLD